MRCWKTEAEDLLFETGEGTYVLLAASGALREYRSILGSNQEYLYTTSYSVNASRLLSTFEEKSSDLPDEQPVQRESIELEGLVETSATPEAIATLKARLVIEGQRSVDASVESEQREARRLRDFEGALLDHPAESDLVFVWSYAGKTVVISDQRGAEVWRESGYPHHGKYLFAEYKKILERKYGARFKQLRLDLSAGGDSLFDPE